jgi:hypothetical protein
MPRPNCCCTSCPERCSIGSAQPPKASNAIASEIETGLIYLFYEAPISLQEGWIVEAGSGHPERSAAESKDPATLPKSNATGFLDFARNDSLAF